ncbi:hypothetical protein Btru_068745 [Bulinus truncatus]|nr:hypothetical protein Btru_068745 [Bulinus truncatus]
MYRQELLRLSTFTNYPPNAAKSASVLAHYGFIYTGSGSDDRVTCFLCRATKRNWIIDDDVFDVHKSLSPSCEMVQYRDGTNTPFSVLSDETQTARKNCVNVGSKKGSHGIDTDGATVENHYQHEAFTHGTSGEILLEDESVYHEISQGSSAHLNKIPAQNRTLHTQSNDGSLQNGSNVSQPGRLPTDMPQRDASADASNVSQQTTNSQSSVRSINQPTPTVPRSGANTEASAQSPTYSQLGIITERPKRTEYGTVLERMKTFLNWPRDHHLKPEELSACGFYYAGYGDCARCFYCGGGLRNWEDDDDVWVEHARWFPKCAYIRQRTGQIFVNTVQEFNRTLNKITLKLVKDKLGTTSWSCHFDKEESPLLRDPAVRSVIELGFSEQVVLEIAEKLKSKETVLSSDDILTALVKEKKVKPTGTKAHFKGNLSATASSPEEGLQQIKEKNSQLRQQTLCKVCMDHEVEMVFLPCGHLVCCSECAGAMKDCPVCRNHVKGMVRTFIC